MNKALSQRLADLEARDAQTPPTKERVDLHSWYRPRLAEVGLTEQQATDRYGGMPGFAHALMLGEFEGPRAAPTALELATAQERYLQMLDPLKCKRAFGR